MIKILVIVSLLAGCALLAFKPNFPRAVLARLGVISDVPAYYNSKVLKHTQHGMQVARKDNTNTIVFIGDSIVEHWDISLPDTRAINLGISGDTSKGVLGRLDDNYIAHVPTWYLAIGVNEAVFEYGVGAIESRIAAIADRLAPVKQLYWQVILPVSSSKKDIQVNIQAYNAEVRKQCAVMANCILIEAPASFAGNLESLTTDGLHPNARGYEALSENLVNSMNGK